MPKERPVDNTPLHTEGLPATPQRDRTIPATAWREAPRELLDLGVDIGEPLAGYKRRIGRWLLWRAGPAAHADARYMALASDDPSVRYTFRLFADGSGEGVGPDGLRYKRFRSWKEALRDAGAPAAVVGASTRPTLDAAPGTDDAAATDGIRDGVVRS